jgi:hypothetical protein
VHRNADRARLLLQRTLHGLADPPRCVGRELEAAAVVELLDGTDQADDPLLDQVEERQPQPAVALGVRDDQAQVRLDHPVLGRRVALLDPFRELDLLGCCEQRPLRDVAQEQLERVAGGLRDFSLRVRNRAAEFARRQPQLRGESVELAHMSNVPE